MIRSRPVILPRAACYENAMERSRVLVLTLLLGAGACATPPAPPAPAPAPQAAVSTPAESAPEHVDGKAAKALVKDGARLVDVRTPQEYADKHVDGAENVPVDTISTADVGPKDKAVVVYCASGKRSKRAADALRARGYTRIYDLGAMSRWDE